VPIRSHGANFVSLSVMEIVFIIEAVSEFLDKYQRKSGKIKKIPRFYLFVSSYLCKLVHSFNSGKEDYMPEAETQDLIKRAQSGNADAFEALVNIYYEAMFKMAFKWCGNQRDAEDITQESCIKLARGIGSYKGDSAFTSWLYRLVINTAKDWVKAQGRHDHGGEQVLETMPAKDNAEENMYASQVWAEVHKLPEVEKESLLLVMAQGLSHKEAAKLCGVKESTISWRIHEARKKLAEIFGKERKHG